MERRTFLGVLSGVVLTADYQPGDLRLTAIAAERLPHSMALRGVSSPGLETIFEVRRYSGDAPPSVELLRRHGVSVIDSAESALLLGFPSLAARDLAWSALSCDPEWSGGVVTEISLYRRS